MDPDISLRNSQQSETLQREQNPVQVSVLQLFDLHSISDSHLRFLSQLVSCFPATIFCTCVISFTCCWFSTHLIIFFFFHSSPRYCFPQKNFANICCKNFYLLLLILPFTQLHILGYSNPKPFYESCVNAGKFLWNKPLSHRPKFTRILEPYT